MFTTTRKFWVIAVVCGLLAAAIFFQYLQQLKSQYQTADTISVVAASENIAANTVITAQQLTTKEIPAQYVHPNAFKSIDDIIGKAAITDIARDEVILSDRLVVPGSEMSSFSYKLEPGQRAESIGVDPVTGVAGYVQAGDHVDIIALIEVKVLDATGSEKDVAYSAVAVQNREVLAVGDKSIVSDSKKQEESKTITLALSLEEAQKVAWATQFGQIRVILRSPIDEETEKRPPISAADLLAY